MNVVIVEDELAASDNLTYLLNRIDSNIKVIKVLDSVKSSVAYFSKQQTAELVFMDIHLADGISFEIFEQIPITIPVIFTTAYNQYTLKAFKVNSIDYLLKP
jgi:two-component system LytT family response regulator